MTKKITDLTVTDENNIPYEYIDKWDTKASFEEKSYKCNIYNSLNRIKLYWGISNYGQKNTL